jgi:tetratricopeptide (TPR) repeat protein
VTKIGAGEEGETPAASALRLVTADPERAHQLAIAARRDARRLSDGAEESTAERALGLVAREQHDAVVALRHLRRAVRVAERAQLPERAAEARMSLALVLAEAGRPARALREIDAAAPALDGLPAARLQMQRALILDRLSRFTEAMDGYGAALVSFRRAGDRLWQARALTNRGVLHTYRGSVRQAEIDLIAAERLYTDLGQDLAAAQVRHNLGFLAARAGDVPGALRWYDDADEYFARTTRPAVALIDRGELLLRARLLPEARAVAEQALAAAKASRMRLYEAQARLMLAEAALGSGDRATARIQATAARRAFVRQRRPAWAALARYAELRASDSARTRRQLAMARSVAADLTAAGWPAAALDARLFAAGLAPDREEAAAELRQVRSVGRTGPAELRARAWHAEALLRDAAGDAAGARRALRAGITVLDRYRAALGATELRTLATSYATDLASTGLRLALRTDRPRSVLWWAERCRAATLRLPPTRPPDEAALAADLATLRQIVAEAGELDGAPQRGGTLLREQRAIEERIRRRSWRASGAPVSGATAAASATLESAAQLDRLPAQLAGRTLVEWVDVDGDLHAVVVNARGFRSRPLGRTSEVANELDALRFGLRRIVLVHGGTASRAAAAAAVRYGVRRLDELLFAPLRQWLGGDAYVLVPVGALHALPWALLPTCRGRPVTVVPSASAWLAATAADRARPASSGHPVLVAGPGLQHAEAEVRRLARHLAPAEVLTGAKATAEIVLAALDGARLAHVAAHGEFRADNPMFSHLLLADGPLTVYDIERVVRPPAVVVLSACDSGLSGVHPGDELMGLTSALLALGTGSVLGSVLPADDEASQDLMVDLHRRLAAGDGPAAALAAAQTVMGDGLDARTVTAAAFVCFGAG